jgi:putative transposase
MRVKRAKTSSFLLELPLEVNPQQARHLRAHLETARCLYNALLGEARTRLRRMRADPGWQAARTLPRTQKAARKAAFAHLRERFGFAEYALHAYAKQARCTWIAEQVDSTMAQVLASRAYHAVNRVCQGKARAVRFKSRGRGLDSVEGKRNDTGLRFVLQTPEEGSQGFLLWGTDQIPARLDRTDPVVAHGLRSRIKYARLVRRKASSPRAQGADVTGHRYAVQLILEGQPFLNPKIVQGRISWD